MVMKRFHTLEITLYFQTSWRVWQPGRGSGSQCAGNNSTVLRRFFQRNRLALRNGWTVRNTPLYGQGLREPGSGHAVRERTCNEPLEVSSGYRASLPPQSTLLDWLARDFYGAGWTSSIFWRKIDAICTYQRKFHCHGIESQKGDPDNKWAFLEPKV